MAVTLSYIFTLRIFIFPYQALTLNNLAQLSGR